MTKKKNVAEPKVSWNQKLELSLLELKIGLFWFFYPFIQWLKVLFTFRTKEQRATWKAEMEEAKTAHLFRVTEETTWSTPRIAMIRSEECQGEAAFNDLKALFKPNISLRARLKDMFSGWNIGWEKRAQAIYRGEG